jgi:hypothetical protein
MKIAVNLKGVKPGQKTCGKCRHRDFSSISNHSLMCRVFWKGIGYGDGFRLITKRLPECIAAEIKEKV